MKRTMVISAFTACGKTYLYENQDTLQFFYYGVKKHMTFCDSDSSKYEKKEGWEKGYVDQIEKDLGAVDFILVPQHTVVLEELKARKIPFVMVFPDNIHGSERDKQLVKNQWFGRILLRDNSFINEDFNKWFNHINEKYDNWINRSTINKYNPESFFLLRENQYLSDIINELIWRKENCDIYVNSTVPMIEDITERISKFYKDIPLNMPIETAVNLLPSNTEQLSDEELRYALTRLAEYSRRP